MQSQAANSVNFANLSLKNIVPEIIIDKKGDLFKKTKAIPYRTSDMGTAHNLLQFLYLGAEAATTAKDGLRYKLDNAFGGGLDLQTKSRKGFVSNRQLVDDSTKTAFADYLESIGTDGERISMASRSLARDKEICGTMYLMVDISIVDDARRVRFTTIDPRKAVKYYDADNSVSSTLLVSDQYITSNSKVIDQKNGKKEKDGQSFTAYPIFPSYNEKGGIITTVFTKNNAGYEDDIYGTSSFDPFWLYSEYEFGVLMGKITATEMVSKMAVWLKDYGMDKDDKIMAAMQIKNAHTNTGNTPNGVAVNFYPDEKPIVERFDINRDTNFLSFVNQLCIEKNSGALNLDPRLYGKGEFKIGIGSSIYLQTLIGVNESSIYPLQNSFVEFWDDVLAFVYEHTNENRFINISLLFGSLADKVIDKLKDLENKQSPSNVIANGAV
jgi:hypothetical protein